LPARARDGVRRSRRARAAVVRAHAGASRLRARASSLPASSDPEESMKTMNEVPFRGAAVALLISIVACSSSHVATNEKVEEATTDGEVSAASAGADWLARHQDPQGYWSAARFAERCEGTPCGGAGQ